MARVLRLWRRRSRRRWHQALHPLLVSAVVTRTCTAVAVRNVVVALQRGECAVSIRLAPSGRTSTARRLGIVRSVQLMALARTAIPSRMVSSCLVVFFVSRHVMTAARRKSHALDERKGLWILKVHRACLGPASADLWCNESVKCGRVASKR